MTLTDALKADRETRIEEAADLYEAVLSGEHKSLIAFLNLAIIYWQATEYGYWTTNRLSREFVSRAGARFREVLGEARRLYPQSTEVHFWERYIPWADLGEPFTFQECEELFRHGPSVLVPAMHLFALSEGEKYEKEARDLLRECLEDGTVRARYIASVIAGILRRRGLV